MPQPTNLVAIVDRTNLTGSMSMIPVEEIV